MRRKVVIIQRTLKMYRLRFYELLKEKCKQNGIDLVLVYGSDDLLTFNDAEIPWGIKVKNYAFGLGSKKMYYQPVLQYVTDADLIIVEQAGKLLINYVLWALNLAKIKKLAFWGHGLNLNTAITKSSEKLKEMMTRQIHHFFAYNDYSRELLEKIGLPLKKITVVNNTIDVESILEEEVSTHTPVRNRLVYLGGIYKEKKIDFLIEAFKIVKQRVPDAELVFIGDGPEVSIVKEASALVPSISYAGVIKGTDKNSILGTAKLITVPASVGLVVIDSFAYGVPLVTTCSGDHGPEIHYINNCNGCITEPDVNKYAAKIIHLMSNEQERNNIAQNCRVSAEKYKMKYMAENFFSGIITALDRKF